MEITQIIFDVLILVALAVLAFVQANHLRNHRIANEIRLSYESQQRRRIEELESSINARK